MSQGVAYLKAVRALRECPHLKIEIWAPDFVALSRLGAAPVEGKQLQVQKMRGSLHCAVHDKTVNRFGRDDEI
jgi:hypothetical protein